MVKSTVVSAPLPWIEELMTDFSKTGSGVVKEISSLS